MCRRLCSVLEITWVFGVLGWNEACFIRKEARLVSGALDWVGSMNARTSLLPILSLAAGFGLVGAVACTLNPQPLPPEDDDRVNAVPTSPGGSAFSDSGQNAPPDARKDAGKLVDSGPVVDGAPSFDAGVDAQVDGGDAGTTSLDATPD